MESLNVQSKAKDFLIQFIKTLYKVKRAILFSY